jgi:hypothetical protein
VANAAAGSRAAIPQRFRVVSGDDLNRITSTLNELVSAGVDPLNDGLFLTALAYRDAGLIYDADRLLDRLAANGAKGKAYFLLRADVFDALGNLDAAAKAFATADAEPNT